MVRAMAGRLAMAAVVMLTLIAPAWAGPAQVPATPAGKQFSAWLALFNAGNTPGLTTFLKDNYPASTVPVDAYARYSWGSGGLDVVKIEASEDTKLTGVVKGRDNESFLRFTMSVAPDGAHTITALDMEPIARPPGFPPVARMKEHDAVRALRAKLEKATAQNKFAGSVLVMKGKRIVFNDSFGFSNMETKYENDTLTQHRIGSMNKMFTAVAVMQLVEAGKIKLGDPLGKYLTDYPNADMAAKVTIEHLLTHTGGTGDVFGPAFDAHRLELRDVKDFVALLGPRDLKFTPGERFAYSNYGYILLGAVIEKVSGESYDAYVQTHIFTPAKMTHTGALPEDATDIKRSTGYMYMPAGFKTNAETLPYRGMPAGGGYSTVEDLARFAAALTSHRLLNARNTALMTTGKVAMGPQKYAYGFIDAKTDDGLRYFGHGGGAPGMNGDLRIFPASGYVVVALSNLDPPAASNMADFISDRLPAR